MAEWRRLKRKTHLDVWILPPLFTVEREKGKGREEDEGAIESRGTQEQEKKQQQQQQRGQLV